MSSVAVAVTVHNRNDIATDSIARWRELTPGPVIVIDDFSDTSFPGADYRFDRNVGVAVAKNKALELLEKTGAEHLFLSDDDTFPTAPDWHEPFVESPEPHLSYNFPSGPSHWGTWTTGGDDQHEAWDRPRGCLLYAHRSILRVVGGMHAAYGRHGGEHGNWSDRIHKAGLTRWAYASPKTTHIRCRDENEQGISSVTWADHEGWKHVKPDALPLYAEYRRTATIPVLIPYRPDGGHRDRLWRHLQEHYWDGTEFTPVIGPHIDGPFNRSLAINTAANLAGNWDVAIIADSDTYVPINRLRKSVKIATGTQKLTSALSSVKELTEDATSRILATGHDDRVDYPVERERTRADMTESSMLAIPANLWHRVGGFDAKFQGWSCEDNAFWYACQLAAGSVHRLDGPAYHLWHPTADKNALALDPNYQANQRRWAQYRQHSTWPQLRAFLNP